MLPRAISTKFTASDKQPVNNNVTQATEVAIYKT